MTISVAQAQLFFLAMTRILAVLVHVPILGGQVIPVQVRLALGIVLTIVIIPWQPLPPEAAAIGFFGFAVAVLKELIVGTLAGFAAALTFAALQIAGEVMGLGSGFGSDRVFNPTLSESGSAYSQLFIMVAMIVFMTVDGHHILIYALARTFDLVPINGPLPVDTLPVLARMTAVLITAGVQMALPILAALTLADIGLGLVARVAPQVQIYFLGLPLKVGISLFALGALFAVIFPSLHNLYQALGIRTLELLGR